MTDSLSRTIATVGIWISFAIAFGFGLCRMNFSGPEGLIAFLAPAAMLCASATLATRYVWRTLPIDARRGFEVSGPG